MRFITMMGTAALSMTAATLAQSTTINEIRTGSFNAEYIEFKGAPGASMAGLTILILGDGTSTATLPALPTKSGAVEWKYTFPAGTVIGANGYLVLHNPGNAALPFPFAIDQSATNLPWPLNAGDTTATAPTNTQIEGDDNQTFLLVSNYSGTDTWETRAPTATSPASSSRDGSGGQDLDTDDNGVLDITPWSAILDSVSLKESNGAAPTAGQDWWYSPTTCGPYISRNIQTTGAPIAKWSFPTPITTTNGVTYTYGAADSGANATGSSLKGVHAAAATAWSTPVGPNGSSSGDYAFSSNNWATNDYYQASASTLNFSGVTLEWAQYRSSTGPADFRVDMSTDGGASFTTVLNTYTLATDSTWASKSIASIPNAGNKDSVIFRFIDIAATGAAAGTNRIDNVLIRSDANAETIVTSYAGPIVGIKQANGTWFIGAAATTTPPGFQDTPGSLNYAAPTYTCGDPLAGDCAVAHGNAFCADACCCAYVGGLDPYCVTVRWDSFCVTAAAGCAANCTALPCPADFNGDRVVAGADLGMLLGGWGGPDYDLNGDGIGNGADLGILLGAWGNCP